MPSATLKIEDFALGSTSGSGSFREAKIGVCSRAVPGVYSIGNSKKAKDILGRGPLVNAVVTAIDVSKKPVLAVVVDPVTPGTVTATTKTGPGTGTVTGSAGPDRIVQARVSTAGVLATAQFVFAVDLGTYGTPVLSAAGPWTYGVPGSLLKAVFAAGTYVLNEVYTFQLDGTVSQTGEGPLPTQTSSPVEAFEVAVEVQKAGGLGVATFKYSLNGLGEDAAWSGDIAVPAGGRFFVPGAGLVFVFAGVFTLDDTYSMRTTAAGYTTTELNNALSLWIADPRVVRTVHIVGSSPTAAAAVTIAGAVGSRLLAAENARKYARAFIEVPHDADIGGSVTDVTVATAVAAFADTRVALCVGDVRLYSSLNGRYERRNVAWIASAFNARNKISEDMGKVALGNLPNVSRIFRDEAASPGLNDLSLLVATTYQGTDGAFIAEGVCKAPAGSDFKLFANGQVMDVACEVAYAAQLRFLNDDFVVSRTTGKLKESEALRIEKAINQKVFDRLVGSYENAFDASDTKVLVDRDENVLSTKKIPIDIRVVPKAYGKEISATIGFQNPSLVTA